MPAVDVEIWYTVFEEPTHMRVKKSFNRTVWVALTISPRVMFNVHGRPFKYRPFHRHRAQDEQNKLDDGMGPETAMREHAMDADLLAKLDERVHHPQQCQVGPGDCALPEQVYSENRREEGNDHSYENDCFEGSRIAKRKGPHEISFLQRAVARAIPTALLLFKIHPPLLLSVPAAPPLHAFCGRPKPSRRGPAHAGRRRWSGQRKSRPLHAVL